MTTDQAEERVERQAREFELLKPYLVQRWNATGTRVDEPTRAELPRADPHPGRQPAHRRGADPHRRRAARPAAGELTALGIVEVPEGMPLSEGATRARQARRLLQRVPRLRARGDAIHPIVRIGRHAAEGIVEARAEQEADLIIFGWGGRRPPARRTDGGRRLLADHRRGRARVAVRHRGRQAARRQGHPAHPRPGPRRPARRAGAALRRRARPRTRRDRRRDPPRAARHHRWPSGPRPSAPSPRSSSSTSGQARPSCARRPTSATRSCARPRRPTWWSWAPRPCPAATGGDVPVRALPEAIAQRAKPTVIVVKTARPSAARRSSSSPRRPRRWTPPTAPPRRRAPSRPGRALVRRVELPPRRVRRPAAAGPAQGEAGPDDQRVLPTLNEAETIGPDRAARACAR